MMTTSNRVSSVVLLMLIVSPVARAVPTTLTYAGVLTDNDVRVEGPHEIVFEMFDDDIGGALLYSETQEALVIIDGELVAELGENALDDTVLAEPEVWLQVTVDGTVLSPRVRLNSVPYALRAEAAQRAVEAALAEDVLSFGGLLPEDVVTNTQLAQLGLANGLAAGTGINIASGTVSIANAGVGSAQLAANAVTTGAITNLAVTTQKIANNAITATQLANGAVGTLQIANNAVTAGQLADGAVGGLQLATNAVSSGNIVDGSVTSAKIFDGAVTTAKLADNAVTSAKIVDATIASADIVDGSVTSTKIFDGAVTTAKLADNAVTSAKIVDGTIASADIADDAVSAAKIKDAIAIFSVTALGCNEDVGTLRVAQATCVASTVGCTAGQCTPCASASGCAPCAQQQCTNSLVGFLVSP